MLPHRWVHSLSGAAGTAGTARLQHPLLVLGPREPVPEPGGGVQRHLLPQRHLQKLKTKRGKAAPNHDTERRADRAPMGGLLARVSNECGRAKAGMSPCKCGSCCAGAAMRRQSASWQEPLAQAAPFPPPTKRTCSAPPPSSSTRTLERPSAAAASSSAWQFQNEGGSVGRLAPQAVSAGHVLLQRVTAPRHAPHCPTSELD